MQQLGPEVITDLPCLEGKEFNDRFVGFEDGKRIATATIRIHEVQHFLGLDTDFDALPDEFKVSVTINDVSCPD